MRSVLSKTFTIGFLLPLIVVLAAFLRLYNMSGTLMFQGDQGRDALIVSRIFTERDLVFIGPVTSVGNMYLGPLYYYFMMPWLWLSYPSPLGPAYGVAILGILTVWLLFKLGSELVGKWPSLVAAALYSVSAITIQYSRFSWNPNPSPLVTLVMLWATRRAVKKSGYYWILVAVCGAVLMQLHYVYLLTVAGAGLVWLYQLITYLRQKQFHSLKPMLTGTLIGLAIVALSLVPLMLFDAKHQWLNLKGLSDLFTEEQSFKVTNAQPLTQRIADTFKETHGRSMHILFEITVGKNRMLNTFLVAATACIWSWILLIRKQKRAELSDTPLDGLLVITSFLVTGILGTAVYDHTVFDHYIAYLYPITFLVIGTCLTWLARQSIGKFLMVVFVLLYLGYNVPRWPLQSNGWTIDDMEATSQRITSAVRPNESYAIVLLSESKDLYGQNYRYFLSTTDHPSLSPEMVNQADALVIINEEKAVTNPVEIQYLPIWEITTFPTNGKPEVYSGNSPQDPDLIILRR